MRVSERGRRQGTEGRGGCVDLQARCVNSCPLPRPFRDSRGPPSYRAPPHTVCRHPSLAFPFPSPHRHPFCRACLVEYIEGAVRQAQCPTCSKPLTVDLTGAGAGAGAGGPPALAGGGAASPASAPGKSQGGGGVRAPKKHSILSRVNLANFQSSTKIEVCVVVCGGGSAGSEVVERGSFEGACCCCPLHA